jgi:hypothetical protein
MMGLVAVAALAVWAFVIIYSARILATRISNRRMWDAELERRNQKTPLQIRKATYDRIHAKEEEIGMTPSIFYQWWDEAEPDAPDAPVSTVTWLPGDPAVVSLEEAHLNYMKSLCLPDESFRDHLQHQRALEQAYHDFAMRDEPRRKPPPYPKPLRPEEPHHVSGYFGQMEVTVPKRMSQETYDHWTLSYIHNLYVAGTISRRTAYEMTHGVFPGMPPIDPGQRTLY